ncbi:MAG TPA: gliding motility-associated C-terminal domain-containing protein [Parafilimonas sp.]|nr:gliding motility-associated C-terminal domain-containing protein [Parafilimonas sp.]
MKFSCLLISAALFPFICFSQIRVTVPWASGLNINFGEGINNPGNPLSQGYSEFSYTPDICPAPGNYSIVNQESCFPDALSDDAGHIFFGAHPLIDSLGYMMLVNYSASPTSKIVFRDTVKDLCGSNKYLFWAGVRNLSHSRCFYPNLSFVVETPDGQEIQSFQTGDIGGGVGKDSAAPYFGYIVADPKTSFPAYYGGIFSLPAGINNIVVKIITNPTTANTSCSNTFAIDNILLTPVGPEITILDPDSPDGWLTGACFKGGDPVALTGSIRSGYYGFRKTDFVPAAFNNPSMQWQQSVDNGYTWADIPGETNLNLSRVFSAPDTFFVRLRVSEDHNINNASCSVVSNVIQVNVDGLPADFDMTSNSPVCTDSDIVFNVSGGATYVVTGPNGFSDNSSYPHIYHPVLADSGWYYTQIISFGGCIANDSTYVQVIGPDLKISVDDSALCYGKSTQLHASGGNVYLWSPPDGLSNAGVPNPLAKPVITTKYEVKVSDGSGCSAYGSAIIKLRDSILKARMIAPDIICPGDVIAFRDTSIGKIIGWNWNFANGQTSDQQHPPPQRYPQYEVNLNYPVKLIVTDSAGCADTTVVQVKAVSNCYIAVPSAFTPNHDGLNDYLYPLNAYKATNLIFQVYNRNGRIVFETKDWTKKWDGTISGMPQPAGTYVWILKYTDEHNTKISLKGTVVLLR